MGVERAGWELLLRSTLWLTLGAWIGAWLLFGAVVAPTAFRVLPSTEVAGSLVGPVLEALHLYGAAAGALLALVTVALGRGPLLIVLPLLMGLGVAAVGLLVLHSRADIGERRRKTARIS